jgi:hypothetical protein
MQIGLTAKFMCGFGVLALGCGVVQAQTTRQGIIDRVTYHGIALKGGAAFSRSGEEKVSLTDHHTTQWTDLRSGQMVRLNLNRQGKITEVKVLGHYRNGRIERPITETLPVNISSGYNSLYNEERNISIAGRVFESAAVMYWKDTAIFSNRDGYDRFQAWVGKKFANYAYDMDEDGRDFSVTFVILGDGKEIFRSNPMRKNTPPQRVDVSVRGYSGISLVIEPGRDKAGREHVQAEFGSGNPAAWADAKLVKLVYPPTKAKKPRRSNR